MQAEADDRYNEWNEGLSSRGYGNVSVNVWNFTEAQVLDMIGNVNGSRGPKNKLYTKKSGGSAVDQLQKISDVELMDLVKEYLNKFATLSFYGKQTNNRVLKRG